MEVFINCIYSELWLFLIVELKDLMLKAFIISLETIYF
jgi:hypothetical protein